MTPFIELKQITKRFAGVTALKDVNLSVYPGEVHALVGENGAGKSTLIKIMSGFHQPTSGECYVEGKKVVISDPNDAIGLKIGVVYQELSVVDSLSVAENVYFGRLPHNSFGRIQWKTLYRNTEAILNRIGLKIKPQTKVGSLGTAQKQLVEIARCLSQDPRFIIMDEPTSSLAPREIRALLDIILQLKKQGVCVLYISHKLDEVFAVSDRITVLRDGTHIATEEAKALNEERLISLMVGRTLAMERSRLSCAREDMGLEVRELTTDQVKNISFYVKKGEIVGFSGLMGAGRTELAKGIFGADRRLSGKVLVHGEEIPPNSTFHSVKAGIGFISESRKEEGIFPNFSVLENMTISSMDDHSRGGILRHQAERDTAEKYRQAIRIKTPTVNQLIVNLSGGNQQKVIIARWLTKQGLKVLIVDEPTRGLDVGAKSEIYALLDEMAKSGLAVVIMSSEMPELLNVCDRIYVMKAGRITAEYPIAEATQENLLGSAI